MSLSTSTPIRLTDAADSALRALQKRTKVNKAALLRLAITAGLPIIAERFAPEPSRPTRKSSRRKVA